MPTNEQSKRLTVTEAAFIVKRKKAMYKKITRSIRESGAKRELRFLGHVHTISDSFCAGMKIIPKRSSVHT